MCLNRQSHRQLHRQSCLPGTAGFSLVSAIFLLLVIAALGVFMLSIYTMQRSTATQDVRGVLAYQAAKAGIEWASFQILTPENAAVVNSIFPGCVANMAAVPALAGALSGFSVRVDCQLTKKDEGGNTIRVYQLTATASKGTMPSSEYVERQISASISTCRKGTTELATDPPC
jgi:MSHA biogenesis protein MshP